MNSEYLKHHGILGQKWGRKMGPPYPLDAGDHSAAEKKEGYKKSLGGGRNEGMYDRHDKKSAPKAQIGRKKSDGKVDYKSYEKFNNSKEAKAAEKKAYDRTIEYFKKNDPKYLEEIIKRNGGKTEGLEAFKDFQDRFDVFHVDEWDKAEKEFSGNSKFKKPERVEYKRIDEDYSKNYKPNPNYSTDKAPTKEERDLYNKAIEREEKAANKNIDAFNEEYAKARKKGEMTKKLIETAGKVEYDRAYEKYSKTMSDPDKIHEKALADKKSVEDYIRVNGMDEYVRPNKKGMKEKAKNYQSAMNQLQLNEKDLVMMGWSLKDSKEFADKVVKNLQAKDPEKNKEKIDYWMNQSKILEKKMVTVVDDFSKNRALIDGLIKKMDSDKDIVYRTKYAELGTAKNYEDYNSILTKQHGQTERHLSDSGYRTVGGTLYNVAAGTDRNKKKKKYTDPMKKLEYNHNLRTTYYY